MLLLIDKAQDRIGHQLWASTFVRMQVMQAKGHREQF